MIEIMLVFLHGNDYIYNVSSNHDFIELEIVQMIKDIVKSNVEIEFQDCNANYKSIYLNSEKIRSLNWSPKKFRDRIKQTVLWYEANQWIFNG
jgi:dTDP-D-glucose 4,6-dehydratase